MSNPILYRATVLAVHILVKLIRWQTHRSKESGQSLWSPSDPADLGRAFLLTAASEASLLTYVFFPGWIGWAALPFPEPVRWAGIAVGMMALALFVWAHRSLGTNFTIFLSIREEHNLVTEGPYRYIRHPIYTVFLLLGLCYFLASANALLALCWIGGGALFFRWRIPREEALLLDTFGESYQLYMERTNRLFPRLGRHPRKASSIVQPASGTQKGTPS